ncbi:MAG: hypothetical protein AB8A46_06065 [Prochlorococcus sp.]|nr:hypothetical protein [Prochlorococcus sp.]CAI8174665.1 MAG: Uncharacterised protein [Prochlorococcus marinus str. MIT 9215]
MSLRTIPILLALTGAPLIATVIAPQQVQADDIVPASTVRALNLARNTAVKENGGLSVYRPEPCMFSTSTGGGNCLIRNTINGFTYQFLGGQPGWPEDGSQPTTETEIQIAPDGRSVNQIIYNGPPR